MLTKPAASNKCKTQSKPIMRWAGSKRKLLPLLMESLPDSYDRYVEPFCGSACLFFELSPERAILSDINPELINALRQIRNYGDLRNELIAIPHTSEEYYRVRSLSPKQLTVRERAVRFMYLNRYCFNGVYRTNKAGIFNVPIGTKTGAFPSENTFVSAKKTLAKAKLQVSRYEGTLDRLVKGDFVYMDPPYSKANNFTGQYGLGSFDSNEIPVFIKTLEKLDRKDVKFLFSYKMCESTSSALRKHFNLNIISVKRHISGFKTAWDETHEILVKNY